MQASLLYHMVVGDDVPVLRYEESGSFHDIDFSVLVRWLLVSGSDADSVEDNETADIALGDFLFPGDADYGRVHGGYEIYGLLVLFRQLVKVCLIKRKDRVCRDS